MALMDAAFHVERIQHCLLVREGTHLKAGQGDGYPIVRCPACGLRQRVVQPVPVALGVVGLETRVVPIGVEGCFEFLSNAGVPTRESRTFHSTPSSNAARERLDDPT